MHILIVTEKLVEGVALEDCAQAGKYWIGVGKADQEKHEILLSPCKLYPYDTDIDNVDTVLAKVGLSRKKIVG